MRVEDVMTRKVLVLHSETTLRDAISYLADEHISGAPVVDGKRKVVGAVSNSDLLQAQSEGLDLDATMMRDIMTSPSLTVGPEVLLREAALAMEYGDVHRLFVERDGELIGVISRSDVSRALAAGHTT